MENERTEGIGHQVEGTFKKTLGKLIGDAKLMSDGAAERALGDAQNSARAEGGQSVAGVDRDRITGVAHQFEGAIEQGLGNLISDSKLVADGSAEQRMGKARNDAGSARDEARENRQTFGDAGKPGSRGTRETLRLATPPSRMVGIDHA